MLTARLRGVRLRFNYNGIANFSTSLNPAFLSTNPNCIDILHSDSNDILLNLATEEYIFEHADIVSPILFLYCNSPSIIIGKH